MRSAPDVQLVRDTETRRPHERGEAVRWWSVLVAIVLVSGIAVWVISPRFAIETPSLVDDWAAISGSPDQMSEIARFTNPEEQRFRPGWILWNYVQWHTLDAPQGLVGANVWNIWRIIVLVAGLCLLTALAIPTPRGRLASVLHAGLVGIPALLVVTVPKFAVDFARFGPQEPLLLGGMALGGSLLVLTARWLLDIGHRLPRWRVSALGAGGAVFWILGTYQKETSLAAIPLIAAVLLVGRRRLGVWSRLSVLRRAALGGVAAIVVLPLLHVLVESVRIVSRGDLVYEAEVDGGLGAARGLRELYDWTHEALPQDWRLSAIGAVLLTTIAIVIRRKVHVLAVGALLSGGLALALAGQSGVVSTRYYIPAFALFAVALAMSLAWFPPIVRLVGLLGILIVFLPPTGAREEVRLWAENERKEGAVVEALGDFDGAGCGVAAAGLDIEQAQALPVLARLEHRDARQVCGPGSTYLVVGPHEQGAALARTCAPGALELLVEASDVAKLYECTRLRSERVRDPELGLVEAEALVALRRLRSGS